MRFRFQTSDFVSDLVRKINWKSNIYVYFVPDVHTYIHFNSFRSEHGGISQLVHTLLAKILILFHAEAEARSPL